MFSAAMMPGGFTDPRAATPEVQTIADAVKAQLEREVNRTYPIFKAVEYRTQVVAGVNYCIKVQVSDDEYVHLLVFKALPHENQGPKLVRYWTGKTHDDPLDC